MIRIFVISITLLVSTSLQMCIKTDFHKGLSGSNIFNGLCSQIISSNEVKLLDIKTGNDMRSAEITNLNVIEPPVQSWFPKAPALPDLPSDVIRVMNTEQLFQAAENVKPGGVIAIADGHYRMPRSLVIRTNDVTLRSESDDRTKVVLDFEGSIHGEGVVINSNSGFMLASLTVQNVTQNGIKINSNLGVDKVTIYNVITHNVWQRHIKGPRVPDDEDGNPSWVEDCHIQYCLFYNDRPKQLDDDPYEKENPDNFNGNYVGGIDIMTAKGWTISDNVFIGIRGRTGAGRGGIFMWHNSFDCVIERNIFINNDSGICLGNSSARGERRHCTGFIVRNNFVTRTNANEGIYVGHTRNCEVLYNTIHNTGTGRLIRIVHVNDGLLVEGNVFSGSSWGVSVDETDNVVPITYQNNLNKLSTDSFTDPNNGNLHLKSTATDMIDKGTVNEKISEDIDCHKRDENPDLGADEFGSVVTGMMKNEQKKLLYSAFPNPTYGNLILKSDYNGTKKMGYRLYDFNGKLLEKSQIRENETVINMGQLKPAVYSLVVYELSQADYGKFQSGPVNTIRVIKK